MRSRASQRSVRAVALATVLFVGSACIEGHHGDPQAGGVLAPGAVGRDPAAVSDISGVVLDDVTRAPIAGVRVAVGALQATTAADGSYRLAGIQAFVVELEASKDGYARHLAHIPLAVGPNTFRILMKRPDL